MNRREFVGGVAAVAVTPLLPTVATALPTVATTAQPFDGDLRESCPRYFPGIWHVTSEGPDGTKEWEVTDNVWKRIR